MKMYLRPLERELPLMKDLSTMSYNLLTIGEDNGKNAGDQTMTTQRYYWYYVQLHWEAVKIHKEYASMITWIDAKT